MFGYVRPMECELLEREQTMYRAYYCGLCKTIGVRYGQTARASLNYDCTFLALFLSAFSDVPLCQTGGCLIKPWREKRPIAPRQPALDYAADVNVLLAYYQQADHWRDDRRISALIGKTLLFLAAHRAKRRQPALAAAVAAHIGHLSEIERAHATQTDLPADAFAGLMRDIVRLAPDLPAAERRPAEWLFYNLGRWIYLIDAWEDREEDQRNGSYNPFLAANISKADASFLLHISLTEAEKAFDLLTLQSHADLLENILRLGCRMRTQLALGEETEDTIMPIDDRKGGSDEPV